MAVGPEILLCGRKKCKLVDFPGEATMRVMGTAYKITLLSNALDRVSARLIELRVLRDWQWIRIAAEIGGGNTDGSLRKRYWRIVRSLPLR